MSARKRYVPEPPVCRVCGAHGDLIHIKHIDEAEDKEVIAEIRCANGHLQLQILKPGADAIARGQELAAKHGWRR